MRCNEIREGVANNLKQAVYNDIQQVNLDCEMWHDVLCRDSYYSNEIINTNSYFRFINPLCA